MPQEIALIDTILDSNDKIERIYINFCNPWPKDRHKKRRLTHTRPEKFILKLMMMSFLKNL